MRGVEEAVLNLNADIEVITHENSERWQFASETISRAQAIRELEGALVALSLCVSVLHLEFSTRAFGLAHVVSDWF